MLCERLLGSRGDVAASPSLLPPHTRAPPRRYERDLLRWFDRLLVDLKKRIDTNTERLRSADRPLLLPEDVARLESLDAAVGECLARAALMGEQGNVDGAQAATMEAEALKASARAASGYRSAALADWQLLGLRADSWQRLAHGTAACGGAAWPACRAACCRRPAGCAGAARAD